MPALSIMIKPASSLCNLRCKYCFYCDVASHRDVFSLGVMKEETAERLIKSAEKYGKSPYGAHLKNVAEGKFQY